MLPDFSFCGDKMNSRIKLSARAAICGSYARILPLLLAAILIFGLFSLSNAAVNRFFGSEGNALLSSVAVLTLPAAVAAISPLCLAMQIRYVCFARGMRRCGRPQIGLSGALKSCDLCVRLFAVKAFWFAVFEAIPFGSALLFLFQIESTSVSLRAAYAVAAGLSMLAAAGLVFWLIFIQRYSKSMFYLACYKDFTPGDAINESVRRTKNNMAEIFLFKLSFAPWLLLCLLILPAFYVIPYYKQSVTCLFLGR